MSQYHIDRIASVLDQTFGQLIDMSDWAKKPIAEARTAFLSRSLAALCIKSLAQVEDTIAANSVTDGYDYGGIDALLFDQTNDTFFFVQSKWDKDGSAPMNAAACGSFADGVQDILADRIDRFNQKIMAKKSQIVAAITATRTVQIVLITAHISVQDIGLHGRRKIDDLVKDLNTPSMPEQAEAVYLTHLIHRIYPTCV